MGHRRGDRSGSGQALTRAFTVPAGNQAFRRRSQLPRAGRGVIFFLALCITGCRPTPPALPSDISLVTIGVPESGASGSGFGIRQFVNLLSLDPFVYAGTDGRATPGLVERWTWETDTRVRLRLRPNVVFHDGTALNAALAATLLRAGVTSQENRALTPALEDIASIEPDGPLDLVLTLVRPSALLLEDLALFMAKDTNIGTGPYRVVPTDNPLELRLERFDQHHRGTPTVAAVVIRPFDTLRTAWSSLLRGEVDVVSNVPADAVEFIRNDDVQVISYSRRYQFVIAFNTGRPALRPAAVRRALNLAIDRGSLTSRVLQAGGTPSTGPVWPGFWAYDDAVQPYTFDPQQAIALLDSAGYRLPREGTGGRAPARLRFTCLLPENFSVYERLALEVQKNLLDIGVDMQIEPVSDQEFLARMATRDFDAIFNDMISGPTPERPYIFWRSARRFRGPYNVFGYENPEVERLFDVLRTSRNDAAVRSATRRLQEAMLNDPPAIFLAWNSRARAIRRDFIIPEGEGDPLNSLWKWTAAPPARVADAR